MCTFVLSVDVALHKSFFCHWFALNLSFLSFFYYHSSVCNAWVCPMLVLKT